MGVFVMIEGGSATRGRQGLDSVEVDLHLLGVSLFPIG